MRGAVGRVEEAAGQVQEAASVESVPAQIEKTAETVATKVEQAAENLLSKVEKVVTPSSEVTGSNGSKGEAPTPELPAYGPGSAERIREANIRRPSEKTAAPTGM